MVPTFEEMVSHAIDNLAQSVHILGPFYTARHANYFISGLMDSPEQITNLCWCLLGFFASAYEVDLKIHSAIGEREQASANLLQALRKHLRIGQTITQTQIATERDPLIQELISHALIIVHRRRAIVPGWLGEVLACRAPHLSPNSPGLDLIALSRIDGQPTIALGEAKAYEKNPQGGFTEACKTFCAVCEGSYNDEIRAALQSGLNRDGNISDADIARNIWEGTSRLGALVACDGDHAVENDWSSTSMHASSLEPSRLFLIASGYTDMRRVFGAVCTRLDELAQSLEG